MDGEDAEAMDAEMRKCVELYEDAMIVELDRLMSVYGAEAIEGWTDGSKYKHRLIHWLAWKGHCRVLEHVCGFNAAHMFSLDVQREVDGCTAAHLTVWYKQPAAMEKLLQLGADPAIANSFGHTAEDMMKFQDKHAEKTPDRAFDPFGGNLIFIDLEFTSGFYEFDQEPKILEAAIVVTDGNLKELGSGSWVVGGFTKEVLEGLADFHQSHFRDSSDGGPFPPRSEEECGNDLFRDIMASTCTKVDVEQSMLNLVKEHCNKGESPIVGYSVQCDREVLKDEMPEFYRYLSHQIIDISSIFKVAQAFAPQKMRQREGRKSDYNHRAMNDVRDSMQSMSWIREGLFGAKPRRHAAV